MVDDNLVYNFVIIKEVYSVVLGQVIHLIYSQGTQSPCTVLNTTIVHLFSYASGICTLYINVCLPKLVHVNNFFTTFYTYFNCDCNERILGLLQIYVPGVKWQIPKSGVSNHFHTTWIHHWGCGVHTDVDAVYDFIPSQILSLKAECKGISIRPWHR